MVSTKGHAIRGKCNVHGYVWGEDAHLSHGIGNEKYTCILGNLCNVNGEYADLGYTTRYKKRNDSVDGETKVVRVKSLQGWWFLGFYQEQKKEFYSIASEKWKRRQPNSPLHCCLPIVYETC